MVFKDIIFLTLYFNIRLYQILCIMFSTTTISHMNSNR